MLKKVTEHASYFAVRDAFSLDRAQKAQARGASVMPDSLLLVQEVFDFAENADITEGFIERDYIAVHVIDRYLRSGLKALADTFDALSQSTGLRLCLIGIGPRHGDDKLDVAPGELMSSSPIAISEPASLTEVARAIFGVAFYIGSSLHGFMMATSFGLRGFLVLPNSRQHRLQGFAKQLELNTKDRLFDPWEDFLASERTAGHGFATWAGEGCQAESKSQPVRHWRDVEKALSGPYPKIGGHSQSRIDDLTLVDAMNRTIRPVIALKRQLKKL